MSASIGAHFLSSLIKRYPNASLSDVLPALPQHIEGVFKQDLQKGPLLPEDALVSYARVEKLIHPSWKEDLYSYLPKEIAQKITSKEHSLSQKMERFLLEYAVSISSFQMLPDPFVCADSRFSFLLEENEENLRSVLELIALFALTEPFLHVVDKARIKRFTSLLNDRQQKFFSRLLLTSRKHFFLPMDINSLLKETSKTAQSMILDKGIELFSQALFGENEALIQLICYKLDINLGKKLLDAWHHTTNSTEGAKAAVQFVFEFLKTRKRSHV